MKKNESILDANTAVAQIAHYLTDLACIYPITPSTPMAETYEELCCKKEQNIFGNIPQVHQMQSEAGVAGALHGALSAGAPTTTFTSSQGLLLMIPNMYKIAGEFLPCVIHTASRSVATSSLNIFNDHSDIMACNQTGFAFLSSNSVQESVDMAVIAHIATYKSCIPILHFFDGFRTSHEIQKIETIDKEKINNIFPFTDVENFRKSGLSSKTPYQKGTAQNGDTYFQMKYAGKENYKNFSRTMQNVMNDFYATFGRKYNLFDFVGNTNAKTIFVSLGSSAETIEEYLNYNNDCGLIKIRLLYPFDVLSFKNCLPKKVKKICVLDRCDNSSENGGTLYKEIVSALTQANLKNDIEIFNCTYGLGGKDLTTNMVAGIFEHITNNSENKFFTVGINDDVTHTSINYENKLENKHFNAMFFGIGSDGTIGASKNTIKLIGEETEKNVQGYFEYDSKKSGGMTIAHIRISDEKIKSEYKIDKADFVAIHNFEYVTLLNINKYLKDNATLLINSPIENLNDVLSDSLKQFLIEKHINVYSINAYKFAKEIGLNGKINTIMQGSFFAISNIIEKDRAYNILAEKIKNSYAKKGEEVINMNLSALKCGFENVVKIKIDNIKNNINFISNESSIFKQLIHEGDSLPVSAFNKSGKVELGTSKQETRNISDTAPQYICENCLQCNMCALACPHSVIRPKLIAKNEKLPPYVKVVESKLLKDYNFALYIDTRHCTGCGVCEKVCPAKNKALKMTNKNAINLSEEEFLKKIKNPTEQLDKFNLRQTAFFNPYFEFCGACAGCGETPYIKLLTMLYGDKLVIANATGCSSIYGGSAPTCPYTKDEKGKGPAWANSLFEDNAEFGYGIKIGQEINKKDDIVFIIGGDGWAYDIGYGGLDHILNCGKNVNILVLDTEVYSNTGGQCSKATPKNASAKFCSNGKSGNKKPLSALALNYKNVFVSQVCLGANPKQCIEAFKEAVEYDGVSLIIAYCPCMNHGIDMSMSNKEMMLAVQNNYWNLFTYNPTKEKPFTLLKPQSENVENFTQNERRYNLNKTTNNNIYEILKMYEEFFNKQ